MIAINIAVLVTIALAIVGGFWVVGTLLVRQFELRIDDRFKSQDKALELLLSPVKSKQGEEAIRLEALAEQVRVLARQLPMEYVRREDWIRFSAAIDHKLDKLAEMIMRVIGGFHARG